MSRLTGRDGENAFILKCFEDGGCEDTDTSKCDYCKHDIAIYKKLAAYEDIGEPDELVKPVWCGECKYSTFCSHKIIIGGLSYSVEHCSYGKPIKDADNG